ncbi:LysM peptidoglycan-binding domain-containing protein [Pukyongiella litopenaei]|uniref:Peptigoglycan-binding protein LysM n=1 Tax=Pukyongiella litopenaei TaxID=2605946 RepID=A0A2S0MKJ8_9RHOB|nr:LysM peptidoglycan-binding domain-containing protein [Pukyongiella litopenaei]AVO36382.1 peptigoglycan-binding protein LysM [Pukyongiella litopenaei]
MARFSGAYGTGWASWALGAAIAAVVALAWYRTPGPDAPGPDAPGPGDVRPERAETGIAAGPTGSGIAPEEAAVPETVAEVAVMDAPTPQPAPVAAPPADAPAPVLPSIDLARVDDSGMVVVAGRAAPGSRVTVLLDGRAGAVQEADAGGAFASIIAMEPGDDPVVLTLSAEADGAVAASEDQVILAPRPARPPAADAGQVIAEDDAGAVARPMPAGPKEDAKPDQMAVASVSPAMPQTPSGSGPTADATEVTEASGTVAVLRASRDGVDLISPSADAAGAPDQVQLDTIGYTDRGEVLLSGRAGANRSVRVYLDNRLVAELGADGAGRWKGRLPDVPPGVYALRLDEMGDGGGVTSRLETPFQREAPEVLERPGAQSPGSAVLREVTVQRGDTLWAISRERYGDGFFYVRVFEANRSAIRDADLIYPGQVFALPDDPIQRQE